MLNKLRYVRRPKVVSHITSVVRAPHDYTYAPNEPRPHDYESPPSSDEIIKIHYLKHYTMWEFKAFDDFEVDSYHYWLRYRFEHMNSETSPLESNPWEDVPLRVRIILFSFPIVVMVVGLSALKSANKVKNNKNGHFGVFSQPQI